LETPGKIYERLINNRFVKNLERNELMNKNTFGFRRGRGTDVAIALLYETIFISPKKENNVLSSAEILAKL